MLERGAVVLEPKNALKLEVLEAGARAVHGRAIRQARHGSRLAAGDRQSWTSQTRDRSIFSVWCRDENFAQAWKQLQ